MEFSLQFSEEIHLETCFNMKKHDKDIKKKKTCRNVNKTCGNKNKHVKTCIIVRRKHYF